MIRKILMLLLLIIGVIMAIVGFAMDKSGSSTKSVAIAISGVLLTAAMLGVMKDDLLDWLSDLIHGKRKQK